MYLQGKHILVGISGGIAAYKIPDLIRRYRKAGAEVKVVTTKNALNFVTPLTLETVSQNAVYTDVFSAGGPRTTAHISLSEWADIVVIAPATANVIAKIAHGIADDALTTQLLAFTGKALIVPAMNSNMWHNEIVQHNIATLRAVSRYTIMPPATGDLACGIAGEGRMPEPQDIMAATIPLAAPQDLEGKSILITAGPTREDIDPVRYISNYSTGKMGYALANQCAARGAQVTLVAGPTNITPQQPMQVIEVKTARQMFEATQQQHSQKHYDGVIFCAAVADYTPEQVSTQKIKRHEQHISLSLTATQDIAHAIAQQRRQGQWLLGFALETNQENINAQQKLQTKGLDYIVLNSLNDEQAGFGYDTNKVTIFSTNSKPISLPLQSKDQVAQQIIDTIVKEQYNA